MNIFEDINARYWIVMDWKCKKCDHMWTNTIPVIKNTCPICGSGQVIDLEMQAEDKKKKQPAEARKKKMPKGAETCQKCARLKRENDKLKEEIKKLKKKQ